MNIKDYTVCGNCSNCGECCSDTLFLDDEEIERIDNYLKEHKVSQHNIGEGNFICPFRNQLLKKCDIYEVRPYICRFFKCNILPEKAVMKRDEINKDKLPRSMAQLFFKDNSKSKFLKDNFGINVYDRGEENNARK